MSQGLAITFRSHFYGAGFPKPKIPTKHWTLREGKGTVNWSCAEEYTHLICWFLCIKSLCPLGCRNDWAPGVYGFSFPYHEKPFVSFPRWNIVSPCKVSTTLRGGRSLINYRLRVHPLTPCCCTAGGPRTKLPCPLWHLNLAQQSFKSGPAITR